MLWQPACTYNSVSSSKVRSCVCVHVITQLLLASAGRLFRVAYAIVLCACKNMWPVIQPQCYQVELLPPVGATSKLLWQRWYA